MGGRGQGQGQGTETMIGGDKGKRTRNGNREWGQGKATGNGDMGQGKGNRGRERGTGEGNRGIGIRKRNRDVNYKTEAKGKK